MGASTPGPSEEQQGSHAVPGSDHRVQGESESSLAPANHRVQAGEEGGQSVSLMLRERSLSALTSH